MYFHRLAAMAALSALAFASPGFAALQLDMVRDVNTASANTGSEPRNFTAFDGKIYFTAFTPATGRELFVNDRVSPVAQLVADLAPNGASSDASLLGGVNGRLIISGDAGNLLYVNEFERRENVIALDPASGHYETLVQFAATSQPRMNRRRGQFGNYLVFQNESDYSLWATDGTVAGTQPLFRHEGNEGYVGPGQICVLDDRVVFLRNSNDGLELWISNGTSLGTGMIRQMPGIGSYGFATRSGAGCYFAAATSSGWGVLLSNGTAEGTGLILESPAGVLSSMAVDENAGLAYVVDQSGTQMRLWRSDQAAPYWSAENTSVSTPPASTRAVVAAGHLVFNGPSTDNYTSIFVSDGTAAGTRPVLAQGQPLSLQVSTELSSAGDYALLQNLSNGYRITPATATASQYTLDSPVPAYDHVVLDGQVYYSGLGVDGSEPWTSDGTVEGTRLVANVAWQTESSLEANTPVAVRGNLLFFAAADDAQVRRRSLWRSDGTAAGTQALPRPAYDGNSVEWVAPLADGVLFATTRENEFGARQLYRTNRDFSQTQPVTGGLPLIGGKSVRAGGGVVFSCSTGQLCALRPGDSALTVLLPGTGKLLGSAGGYALFINTGGLWRSDGTLAGTQLIYSGLGGGSNSNIDAAYVLNGRLLFEGCTGNQYTCSLWSSDGTTQGTSLLRVTYWPIVEFAPFGNSAAFLLDGSLPELWVTDGTVQGTRFVTKPGRNVRGLAGAGGRLHMIDDFLEVSRYVVSDGTAAGTVEAPLQAGIRLSSWDKPIAVDNGTVVFRCFMATLGYEACAVDHRGQNMRVLGDYYQGPSSSNPFGFNVAAAGGVYVPVNDGRHGTELWRLTGDRLFTDSFQWQ